MTTSLLRNHNSGTARTGLEVDAVERAVSDLATNGQECDAAVQPVEHSKVSIDPSRV
jgi:hypothetical protein